jgi:hypothetical protein
VKHRIKPEEIAWFQAFEKVRKLYEPLNQENKPLVIKRGTVWLNVEPAWVAVKDRDGQRIFRRGDPRLIEFAAGIE